MRPTFLFFLLTLIACDVPPPTTDVPVTETTTEERQRPDYALVIHGGAGTILPDNITDEQEASIRAALTAALTRGEEVLRNGGTALEAVTETIQLMENSDHFNAGRGAVFTHAGTHELDASVMTGHDLNAGAVSGVTNIKNPILAARGVLEKSVHVLLSGSGAEEFAQTLGLETVENSYFDNDVRRKALENVQKREQQGLLDPRGFTPDYPDYKFGTVGCVALDKNGNLAAGTSTGGMTNKRYGRIGDSPIIGAGTYADNSTCGVSSTGHGEFFIRHAVAYDIAARMRYLNEDVQTAANTVVNKTLKDVQGAGGVIAMDAYGQVAMPFNTPGMYRGYVRAGEERVVGLFAEEQSEVAE